MESLAKDKKPSLVGPFVSYEEDEVLSMTPGPPHPLWQTLKL